jgi:phosphatidylinositol dimannoside acyltransferase
MDKLPTDTPPTVTKPATSGAMPRGFRDIVESLRPDSSFWRRFMALGVEHGPEAFVRYSPPVFGLAFAAGMPAVRERVRTSLRRMLGPLPPLEEARTIAGIFANYASSLTEAMLLGTGRGYGIVSCAFGVENYEACVAEGKGIIIATAHTAGWEAAGPMLSRARKREVVVVMARERDERARALQDELRTRAGVKIVHIGETAFDALPLLRHLKQNAVVAMQIDRVPQGMRSRTVNLSGEPWQVPEGPLQIAALSGAPIMPVFTRRLDFMTYEAIAHTPIHLPRRPTPAELDAAAQKLADTMAAFVRRYPTQWFNFA